MVLLLQTPACGIQQLVPQQVRRHQNQSFEGPQKDDIAFSIPEVVDEVPLREIEGATQTDQVHVGGWEGSPAAGDEKSC